MSVVFRHRNGGGLVFGIDPAAGSDCFLSPNSSIVGRTYLSYGTSITDSSICDSSISASEVENSAVMVSHVAGSIVHNSALEQTVIRGNSRRAVVEDSILSNHVVVEGCRIRNVSLDGPYLLHADCDQTPRHFLMEEEGIRLGVVECSCRPGVKSGIIGCCCRPLSLWIERAELLRRIFQKRGWSGYQIDMFRELFTDWQL